MNNSIKALALAQLASALAASGMLVREGEDSLVIEPKNKPADPMPNGVVLASDLESYPLPSAAIEKLREKTARTVFDVQRMLKAEAKRSRKRKKSES